MLTDNLPLLLEIQKLSIFAYLEKFHDRYPI